MATLASDLVARVRLRCDIVNSQYCTDAEILNYINVGLGELHDLLTCTADDRVMKSSQATITGADPQTDSNYFALPSDFQSPRGVDLLVGGVWATLSPFQHPERNRFNYPILATPYSWIMAYYKITDSRCYVIPASFANNTFRLWYVPRYSDLGLSDPLPDYMAQNAWSEFAVCDASAKILQKQDLDATLFLQQKESQKQRILNAAISRDQGPPKRMMDTRSLSSSNGWGWWGGGGNGGGW